MLTRTIITFAVFTVLGGGAAFAKTNSAFLDDALKGSNSEIALGELAIKRGSSTAVKDFGQTLVTDHRKAKEAALPLAKKFGVKPSDALKPEAKAEEKKLLNLSGKDFDQEFASFMAKDHQKEIKEFQDQAKKKDDVGKFAEQTVPVLEKHLNLAQGIVATK